MLKAFWAEGKEYPEEGGCIVIARDESDALPHGLKALNVSPDEINLYSAETAKGELHERLSEIEDAMQKASDEARAEEREACLRELDARINSLRSEVADAGPYGTVMYEHSEAIDALCKARDAIHARKGIAK